MNTFAELLNGNLAHSIGWALLHLVWQGAIVAGILACVLVLLRRQSAHLRYLASCTALFLLIFLPTFTATRTYLMTSSESFESSVLVSSSPSPADFESPAVDSAAFIIPTSGAELADLVSSWDWKASGLRMVDSSLPWMLSLWITGVLFLSIRLAASWVRAHRCASRHKDQARSEWQTALRSLAGRMNLKRPIRLVESAMVEVPTVIGWLRPVIILPFSTLAGLTYEQVEMILAHELAHIRRHDFAVNLLQAVVETVLFFHPAVWWISKQVRIERENCCDDLAIAVCGNPLLYARALTNLEEMRAAGPSSPALAATGGSLLERIRRLVCARSAATNPYARWAAGLALFGTLSILIVAAPVSVLANQALAAPETPEIAEVPATPPTPPAPKSRKSHDESSCPDEARKKASAQITVTGTHEDDEDDNGQDWDASLFHYEFADAEEAAETMAVVAPLATMRALKVVTPELVARLQPMISGISNEVGNDVANAMAFAFSGSSLLDSDSDDDLKASEALDKPIGTNGKLSVDELIAIRTTGVTPDYIAEMQSLGFKDLTLRDVIRFRKQGVSADFVKQIRALGLSGLSSKQIVSLRNQGVTPDYIRGLRKHGLDKLSAEDYVKLRNQGVDEAYIKDLADAGLVKQFNTKELIRLRNQGVNGGFIRELRDAGYASLSVEDLITLRMHGVSGEFVKSMKEAGYEALTAKDLVRLRQSGVDETFMREMAKYKKK